MRRNSKVLYMYLAGIILLGLLILFGPILWWNNISDIPLNIWIVDKTVPKTDYREHKGLMWVLNHNKVINDKTGKEFSYDKDYFGFFPANNEDDNIREIPDGVEYPDLIYLADTYGVYTNDFSSENFEEKNGNLIYGGLDKLELDKISSNIGSGNTIIGEFNIASSPTKLENREKLESIFGVKWSGWRGRYFKSLETDIEVPQGFVENYEKQERKDWDFKGSGYVLLSDSGEILVLENEKHIGDKGLSIRFEEEYMEEFGIDKDIPYYYWFEFLETDENTETIANYQLDLSSQGEEIFKERGFSSTFTAVARRADSKYTAYYFSGDFADLDKLSKRWNYYGLQDIKKATSIFNKKAPDYFYWNAYAPMMKKIISDLEEVEK